MNMFAKFATATALAATLTLPLAAPAAAGEKSDDIVVSSNAAMAKWQDTATNQLNRMLARAPMARSYAPNETIVQVTFSIDADGDPQDITVLDGDANWGARQTALYAIKRLSSLSQVPVRNPQNAKFLANLIFAQDAATHRQLAAKLDASTRTRLAEAGGEESYILLGS